MVQMMTPAQLINIDRALIFRVTHRSNLPLILENGLHCQSGPTADPAFRQIGDPEVIDRRQGKQLPETDGEVLDDYVPFYFTPWSPMLFNIVTGRRVAKVARRDLVFIVGSLRKLADREARILISDRNCTLATARLFSGLEGLDHVGWPLLQSKDFRRRPDDPERFERYQAEALVHRHVAVDGLTGFACYDREIAEWLSHECQSRDIDLPIACRPDWFF